MEIVLILMTLFVLKHFIVDFPIQTPYQWMNKGNYGHPGGLLHSGLHAFATYLILFMVTPIALGLAAIDFAIHYHVDWAKMNINNHYGWKADKDAAFWVLLGIDQLLHYLTYILIIALAVL